MSSYTFFQNKLDSNLMTSEINFCELLYFTLPKSITGLSEHGKTLSFEKTRRFVSELSYVSSSERATSFVTELKASLICKPKIAIQSITDSKFVEGKYILNNRSDNELERLICKMVNRLRFKSVACYLSTKGNDAFFGVFIVLSDMERDQLQDTLNQSWISTQLDLLNFYLPRASASINRAIYNPWDIPSKTVDVLRLASQGETSKVIGEKLNLTTRGVEYHLDKAKNFLNAANKVQLISMAKDCCLI